MIEEGASCEAADRNKRALYELDNQWGSRQLDYAKLRRILTGECDGGRS
jgi:hypothetical protein